MLTIASLCGRGGAGRRWRRAGASLVLAAALLSGAAAGAEDDLPVIRDPGSFWSVEGQAREREHAVALEFAVCYFDPDWNLLWGTEAGINFFLPLRPGCGLAIRSGQRVRLEGEVVPAVGFAAPAAKVTVLAENAWPTPVDFAASALDAARINAAWVEAEGLVLRQMETDPTHIQLLMMVEGHWVNVRMLMGASEPIPQLNHRRVKLRAVCVATPDSAGKRLRYDFWVPSAHHLSVTGHLDTDPRFALPRTPLEQLGETDAGGWVRVTGRVHAVDAGRSVTVRDDTGQITLLTPQPEAPGIGERIEFVARVDRDEGRVVLRAPLFRAVAPAAQSSVEVEEPPLKLRVAAQVLELDPGDAVRRYPVSLRGVVTWSDASASFFYFEDTTGGVRVRLSPGRVAPPVGESLVVEGLTAQGALSPEIILTRAQRTALFLLPPTRVVTLDQALGGSEEGRRVELRGYVRDVVRAGELWRLDLTAPTGVFQAFVPANAELADLKGAVVRISGVCAGRGDAQRQLAGFDLWVAGRDDIAIEDARPADIFAVPEQSILSLRQYQARSVMSRRVRVTGTVLLQKPGAYLQLQEGEATLLVLSRDRRRLAPGTKVEVVGFPGRVRNRIALREAELRIVALDPGGIVPFELQQPGQLEPELDGRLVRADATLLESGVQGAEARLTLQSDGSVWEATLAGGPSVAWEPGSRLRMTGVYLVEFDDDRRPRGFQLALRSPGDVEVLAKAPWWNARRIATLTGVFGVCLALGLGWVMALRRRVARQTEQIRAQMEKEVRLQAELERTSRLESLGMLAGGIAHDFNNLLTAIIGNLGLVALEPRAMDLVGRFVRDAERASRRAAEVTQQLLTFAKGGDPVRKAVMLPEIVQEAATFALHGAAVKSEFVFAPELPAANVDAGQISRVVHNLVLNAVQAMPAGGVVRLELAACEVADGEVATLAPGHYVLLAVSDNGPGISPEDRARIFEPYFSTRSKGPGHGLGLATVHSIITKHQGHIALESAPGHGSTFRVWLPAAKCPPAEIEEAPIAPAAATRARVLLMDDEEIIREVARMFLERLGHEVVATAEGSQAVKAHREAKEQGRPFDVVLLDLTVPGGMGGVDALREMLRLDPTTRAIASSGYSSDPVMANHRAYGFRAVLPKPYDLKTFTAVWELVRRG